MDALEKRGIPYRNEQQLQDISAEPLARLIVDYLACLYGQREPKAWIRLMSQLIPLADEEVQASARHDFQRFFAEQRKGAAVARGLQPTAGWWEFAFAFLQKLGGAALSALSPDYESKVQLGAVIKNTRTRIGELLQKEPDLAKALACFSDDEAVRILTIHKSKGLELDSVIILGVETETFWGNADDERCGFSSLGCPAQRNASC